MSNKTQNNLPPNLGALAIGYTNSAVLAGLQSGYVSALPPIPPPESVPVSK